MNEPNILKEGFGTSVQQYSHTDLELMVLKPRSEMPAMGMEDLFLLRNYSCFFADL